MDKINWLIEIHPEIIANADLPLIISDAQCLSGFAYNQDEKCLEWEIGRQKAVINLYDNISCLLRHSPHKNISRMFE